MKSLGLAYGCSSSGIMLADKRAGPNVDLTVRNKVLPQALTLIRSTLLQGQALLALQNFFGALVYSANTSFDVLLDSLLSTAKSSVQTGGVAKQSLFAVAQYHYDVKMPRHLNLSKLADKCPSAVLAVLDSLVDPLEKTINFRPKQDAAVKQEVHRNEDMINSVLRAIASLNHISHKFKNLVNEITKSDII